jgi:hypothetical protein
MTASAIPPAAIAAELDRKIAGTEPLLDVVRWYSRACLAKQSRPERSSGCATTDLRPFKSASPRI